jgi:hypothetical protein
VLLLCVKKVHDNPSMDGPPPVLSARGIRMVREYYIIPLRFVAWMREEEYWMIWSVDIAGESFVLRIGGKNTHLLGIDRGRERVCTAIAAQMGVGAEVASYHASEANALV